MLVPVLIANVMLVVMWVALYIPTLFLAYALVVWLRRPEPPRWASALGWITLWTVPALAYQCVWWHSPDSPYSVTIPGLAQAAPVGLWVLLGGRTVVEVFEATARALTGHRSATMLDNVHVFLALTVLQSAVLVAILARRDRDYRRDPWALAIGAGVLVNGVLAAQWPWWGS